MTKAFFTIISATVFFITTSVYLSHAQTNIGLESFQINPETDIEITAQSMIFNSKTDVTEFFKNVNVTYGQLNLSANRLTVSQSKYSNKPSYLNFLAIGSIIINNKKNIIGGDQATFFEENQELIILGNVSLIQDGNKIFGDRLVLDLKKGTAKISGSVRTIIAPSGKK